MSNNNVRWAVVGFREAVYQACHGAPVQPGGCCDNCGQGIRYVVTVKSTEGRVMDVGQDCAVTLDGGPELVEIRRAERAYYAEIERTSPEGIARRAAAAALAAARKVAAAEAETDYALALAYLRTIVASRNVSEYAKNQPTRLIERILLGEGAQNLPLASDEHLDDMVLAHELACLPEVSTHVGQVGDKVTREAIFEAMIPIASRYGTSYLYKFRARAGECLVWFSKSGTLSRQNLGCWVSIKGTVKEHSDYQGSPQTKLLRCKTAILQGWG